MSALGLSSIQPCDKPNRKMLFFLPILSVLMIMSIFASFLAPLPLIFTILLFGRVRGWLVFSLGLLFLLAMSKLGFGAYWIFYLACFPFILILIQV